MVETTVLEGKDKFKAVKYTPTCFMVIMIVYTIPPMCEQGIPKHIKNDGVILVFYADVKIVMMMEV